MTNGELFGYARTITVLLVILITLYQLRRIGSPKSPFFGALQLLIGLAFITESVGLLTSIFEMGNTIFYNLFTALQAFIICYMLFLVDHNWKRIYFFFGILSLLLMLRAHIIADASMPFLSIETILVIFLGLCALCLIVLIKLALLGDIELYKMPEFWVLIGFLVYFGGLSPYLSVMRHLNKVDAELVNALRNIIIPCVVVFHYLLLIIGCNLERKKNPGQV